MKFIVRLVIYLIIGSAFLARCAKPSAPEGGPKDSLPPLVVRTTPAMYATNFTGKKVLIEFNEYVQLKDQQKLFFVSPPLAQKPRLTVKKKGVEILFETDLDSATTYRLDFGSSIVDNTEENKLDGYSFVFSTGGHIDSLAMAGQTIGAYKRDTAINSLLFFFDAAKADTAAIDSTMFNGKIEAIFRSDSSGYFIADILKDKHYRIFALDDTNGDQKYQPGTDRIGFFDKSFNPTELGGFTIRYDEYKKHVVIDSLQIVFELFKEIPVRRQLITKQERPNRQKILMTFNALNPVIDSLILDSIPPEWIIRENGIVGDTVILWIAPPTKELLESLKDTIRGTMLLQKEDSVWIPYNSSEKIVFTHKIFDPDKKREERKQATKVKKAKKAKKEKKGCWFKRKKKQPVIDTLSQAVLPLDSLTMIEPGLADSLAGNKSELTDTVAVDTNKLIFKVIAENILNPENHIAFEFDYPLRIIDSSLIELYQMEQTTVGRGRTATSSVKEVKAQFSITNSPENPRRWIIRTKWKIDDEYKLIIPAGVFEDITFAVNDTLESKFKIANPDKFGQLIFNTEKLDSSYNGEYILELVQGYGDKQTIAGCKKKVKAGDMVKFAYLKPGTYALRVVRDENCNGIWDTGSITERRQTERVRMLIEESGREKQLLAKENWQVEEKVDLKKLFED